MKLILSLFFLLCSVTLSSQNISGMVVEIIDDNEVPIVGANLYWIDNSGGTISDIDGKFKLANPDKKKSYVVSFVGYQNDTISLESEDNKIILEADSELGKQIEAAEFGIVFHTAYLKIIILQP